MTKKKNKEERDSMGNGKEYRDGKRDQILDELKESALRQEEIIRQLPPIMAKTSSVLEKLEQGQNRMEVSLAAHDSASRHHGKKKGILSWSDSTKVIGALVTVIIVLVGLVTQGVI